ncbi:hypothetical protein GCM10022403_092350 [Streptomyces coacervatus]|uniref:Uncharacterized protein n=1 Tax=Streptomyces coacervatus TaxID=647381 RepID=A0ABP7JIY8_9ACTN|nr:hypothetical protein [Streptomyces coacervatus]MDF2273282.1 hypothetical protein [Streptomyces coacervatus]
MRTFRFAAAAAMPLILAVTTALVGSEQTATHTHAPRAAQVNGEVDFNMPVTINIYLDANVNV